MTTAHEFLDERSRGWLKVRSVPGERGGYDIALIIDGTYYKAAGPPDRMVAYWAERLAEVLAAEGITLR